MKKENLKENSNEEYLDEDTKKLKIKFKSLGNWASLIEGVMIVPIGLVIILLIGGLISCIVSKESNIVYSLANTVMSFVDEQYEEGTDITTDDIIRFSSIVSGDKITREDYMEDIEDISGLVKDTEKFIVFLSIMRIIMTIICYVIVIFVIENLRKIFLNVEKEGTPFTADNIKYLRKINILAIILFLVGNGVGLVSLIIISSITYIFKHGYKLQQQVDETI